MHITRINYCGLKHDKLSERFSGAPFTFIGSFAMNNNDMVTWNVYHAANPNRAIGHKDYMLLHLTSSGGWVAGRSIEQMEEERYQTGLYCPSCDEVVYSLNRHDMHYCSCGKVAIDGGKAYDRVVGSSSLLGTLDLLEYRFKLSEEWIKLEVRDEKTKESSDSVPGRRRRARKLPKAVQPANKRNDGGKRKPKLHAKKPRVERGSK